jgi:hypothetical protein
VLDGIKRPHAPEGFPKAKARCATNVSTVVMVSVSLIMAAIAEKSVKIRSAPKSHATLSPAIMDTRNINFIKAGKTFSLPKSNSSIESKVSGIGLLACFSHDLERYSVFLPQSGTSGILTPRKESAFTLERSSYHVS